MEAIHYRVPMVGLPIYLNQEDNLSRLIEKGIAVGVSKWSDSEEIYQAIIKVIYNERSVALKLLVLDVISFRTLEMQRKCTKSEP